MSPLWPRSLAPWSTRPRRALTRPCCGGRWLWAPIWAATPPLSGPARMWSSSGWPNAPATASASCSSPSTGPWSPWSPSPCPCPTCGCATSCLPESDASRLPPNVVGSWASADLTSGAGKEAFGDGSDRLVLDLDLEAQQLDRGDLVEPFPLHDDPAGLLDAGVMVHCKPQR